MNDFYNKIYSEYSDDKYFEETVIEINYIIDAVGGKRQYLIENIVLKSEDTFDELKRFIDNCNRNLKINEFGSHWQLFYLYKEIFQFFMSKDKQYNFFRGQSDNYSLRPGILRESTTNAYRKNFENLYLKIAHEFPERVKYYKLEEKNSESIESREYPLSMLQHYGLKTSLLDITSNPYIAMLFMLSGDFSNYKEPAMFLFKIDDSKEREESLFSDVSKNKLNERILAQKGAFLNFDKVGIESNDLEKINIVKIVLKFDESKCKKYISEEKRKIKKITTLENSTNNNNEEDSGRREYLKKLENLEKNIDSKKVKWISNIREELLNKLREYYYFNEDLFPDFEDRINFWSEKYNKKEVQYIGENKK